MTTGIKRGFESETYNVDIRSRSEGVVQSAFIGFPGLPYELGLSGHRNQKMSVKVEIDTNPPEHAVTQTSVVRRHVLLHLLHYDKSSLLAGKLHALIQRPFVKGRVARRIEEMDWKRVIEDVSPFLERSEDIELLTRENLLTLLQGNH